MQDVPGYFVKHSNYQESLIENIDKLRVSGDFVDCTLEIEGKNLKAHKVILAASSLYFANLFNEYCNKESVCIMKDVTFDELRATLDFIYRGEVVIPQDQLDKFIKTAKAFQIKGFSETETFNTPVENNNEFPKQKFQVNEKNCQLEKSFSDTLKPSTDKRTTSIADDLLEDSRTESVSSREGSQSSDLKNKICREVICELDFFDGTQKEQIVPALELAPLVDVNSHHYPEKGIQSSFKSLEIPKEIVNDCSLSDNLSKTKDVLKTFSCREDSQISVSKKKKTERVWDIDSTDITQEQQVVPVLKLTLHETGKAFSLHSEPSGSHCLETSRKKKIISNHRSSKKSFQYRRRLERKYVYSCPQCGRNYKKFGYFLNHLKGDCSKGRQFQCNICQKRMKRISDLVTHLKKHNSKAEVYSCQQCKHVFKDKATLTKHLTYECEKEPQFECHFCQAKYIYKCNLALHIRKHLKLKKTNKKNVIKLISHV